MLSWIRPPRCLKSIGGSVGFHTSIYSPRSIPPTILCSLQQEHWGAFRVKLRGSASAAAAAGLEDVICRLQGFLITPKLRLVLMPLLALPSAKTSAIKPAAGAAQDEAASK